MSDRAGDHALFKVDAPLQVNVGASRGGVVGQRGQVCPGELVLGGGGHFCSPFRGRVEQWRSEGVAVGAGGSSEQGTCATANSDIEVV